MSSIIAGSNQQLGYCEALLLGIEEINGCNNTSFRSDPVGTMQALFDPANRDQAEFNVQDGPSVRYLRVKRLPRGNYTEAEDQVGCETTTEVGFTEQIIEVCESANISFEVDNETMQKYCREAWLRRETGGGQGDLGFMNYHLQFINSKLNGIRQRINRKIITKMLANPGYNITHGVNTAITLDMIDSVTGAKLERGIGDLVYDMKNNEVNCQPIIVGFGNFDKFNTSANYGCCNSNGLDWAAMIGSAPYRYYHDFAVGELASNQDVFFAMAPGATQFVFYNNLGLGLGSVDQRHGDTIYGTIVDPAIPGLLYNVAITETNCKEGLRKPAWQISIYVYFDVAFIPDNAFGPDDRLRVPGGISNGLFLYEALAV
jgi:hypothetical protein